MLTAVWKCVLSCVLIYTLVAKMPGIPSCPLIAPEFHSTKALFIVDRAKCTGGGMSLWDGASVPECPDGR